MLDSFIPAATPNKELRFFGIVEASGQPNTEVRFVNISGSISFGVDNVEIGGAVAAVPEPSSLGLLAVGPGRTRIRRPQAPELSATDSPG